MKRQSILFGIILVVALVVLIVVLATRPNGSGPAEKPKTVKIGVVLPLTGGAAYLGNSVKNGMELAVEYCNKELAAKKIMIKLLYEDSGDQVKNAVSAYTKLTSVDKAEIIVCVSAGWKALIPMAERDERVLFCTVVSPSKVAAQSPWAFRFFISADSDATIMAEFAAKHLKLSKAAIVYVNDEFGTSYRNVFTNTFKGHGGNVVAAEGFNVVTTDFRPILTRIKAAEPEAVYLLAYGNNMALVPKQMRDLGIEVPILSIGTISQPDIMKQAGDSVDGTYYTTTQFNTFSPATPELKQFVDAYARKHKQPPIFFEVFGYDTLNILGTAANRGGTSAEDIRSALMKMKDYRGAAGTITFSVDGEANFPVVVRQIASGKLVDVNWDSR